VTFINEMPGLWTSAPVYSPHGFPKVDIVLDVRNISWEIAQEVAPPKDVAGGSQNIISS